MLYARYRVVERRQFDGHASEHYLAVIEELEGVFLTSSGPGDPISTRSYVIDHDCNWKVAPSSLDEVFVLANMERTYCLGYSMVGTVLGVYATLKEATDAYPQWRPIRENHRVKLLHGHIDVAGLTVHRFYDEHVAYGEVLKVKDRQRQYWMQQDVPMAQKLAMIKRIDDYI